MAVASEGREGNLEQVVVGIAKRLMAEQGLSGEPTLASVLGEEGLGFDSMGRLDLLAAIEKEAGVTIPEKYWSGRKLRTLGDVVKVSARKGG
jgi:acyl carrier protein